MTIAMSEQVGISKQRGFRLRCFLERRVQALALDKAHQSRFPNSNGTGTYATQK